MVASKDCIEKADRARLFWTVSATAVVLCVTVALVHVWNSRTTGSIAVPTPETAKSQPAIEAEPAPAAVTRQDAAKASSHDVARLTQPGTNLNETEVQARAAELMQLAMNNDAASLETILIELRDPNRDIREAALQAAIQFGSRDAIPSLTEAAQLTDEESERTQLLAAVEFLKLPSLTELMLKSRNPESSSSTKSGR